MHALMVKKLNYWISNSLLFFALQLNGQPLQIETTRLPFNVVHAQTYGTNQFLMASNDGLLCVIDQSGKVIRSLGSSLSQPISWIGQTSGLNISIFRKASQTIEIYDRHLNLRQELNLTTLFNKYYDKFIIDHTNRFALGYSEPSHRIIQLDLTTHQVMAQFSLDFDRLVGLDSKFVIFQKKDQLLICNRSDFTKVDNIDLRGRTPVYSKRNIFLFGNENIDILNFSGEHIKAVPMPIIEDIPLHADILENRLIIITRNYLTKLPYSFR